MLIAFPFQADPDGGSFERANLALVAARQAAPGARIIHLTNETWPALDGADDVQRVTFTGDFMVWLFQSMVAVCSHGEDVLQIGTDAILLRDPREALGEWDWAACRYPARTRPDRPYCSDVVFVRPHTGFRVYADAWSIYLAGESQDGWEDGQTALTRAADRSQQRVAALDFDEWCFTPEVDGEIPPQRCGLVHFRGPRKRWMVGWGARLGLCH